MRLDKIAERKENICLLGLLHVEYIHEFNVLARLVQRREWSSLWGFVGENAIVVTILFLFCSLRKIVVESIEINRKAVDSTTTSHGGDSIWLEFPVTVEHRSNKVLSSLKIVEQLILELGSRCRKLKRLDLQRLFLLWLEGIAGSVLQR